jgi:hypothetical protein
VDRLKPDNSDTLDAVRRDLEGPRKDRGRPDGEVARDSTAAPAVGVIPHFSPFGRVSDAALVDRLGTGICVVICARRLLGRGRSRYLTKGSSLRIPGP